MIKLEKECKRCGKIFKKPYHVSLKIWVKQSKYCSWECRKNPAIECVICAIKFIPHGKKRLLTAKYCSFVCARKGQSNWKGGISRENNPSKFSYGQRQRIWKRDKRTCQGCGIKRKDMVVHHKTFKKDVTNDNNLILLCRVCHMKIHAVENSSRKKV